ncbi:hypothetical protein M0804_005189 [Polistes exclamans]|nr:hypothetical protein M0804_005189 [Polistes exclamans]
MVEILSELKDGRENEIASNLSLDGKETLILKEASVLPLKELGPPSHLSWHLGELTVPWKDDRNVVWCERIAFKNDEGAREGKFAAAAVAVAVAVVEVDDDADDDDEKSKIEEV